MKIIIKDKNDTIFRSGEGKDKAYLTRKQYFKYGDYFQIEVDRAPCFVWIQLDEAIQPALIYLQKKIWTYDIPLLPERESPFAEGAFQRKTGYSWARYATASEIEAQNNLSQNSYDQPMNHDAFPHASANAETRGEAVFLARNAIDGVLANTGHGSYPYASWGIDGCPTAELRLDFGRPVLVQRIGIVLRADYPHDTYWDEATVTFGTGKAETQILKLKKTADEQYFNVSNRQVTTLTLSRLKSASEAGYAALTQIEVFGTNL